MTNDDQNTETASDDSPKWQKLDRTERRVAGVLVEKAKTTPDNYPLTLNSLLNGANQKSNRFPQMQLDEEHVFDALERLRKIGAIAEVQGDSRAAKFRHLLYDWLGVDKVELAVMAELLLRGAHRHSANCAAAPPAWKEIPGISDLRPDHRQPVREEPDRLSHTTRSRLHRYARVVSGSRTRKAAR